MLPGSLARFRHQLSARLNQRRRKARRGTRSTVELLEVRQLLTTFVVDRLGDVSDGNFEAGQQTLREAIERANANPGKDTIMFSQTILSPSDLRSIMNSSSLVITDDLEIIGPGIERLRISASGTSLFVVESGVTLSVSDFQTSGGFGLTEGQGGAIHNSGVTIVERMLIRGTAQEGGGIFSTGDVYILNSTMRAGSIRGGGLYVASGNAEIVNTTISIASANQMGGGLYVHSGSVSIVNSTIAKNHASSGAAGGGGIFINDGADVRLENTIVMGNTGSANNSDIIGTLNSASSYNIIGDAATSGGLTHGVNHNIVGNSGSGTLNASTVLNTTLADNGGPTQTLALIPGSIAIDSGNNALAVGPDGPLTTDQRGYGRYVNGTVDRGAYEYAPMNDLAYFDPSTGIWWLGISEGDLFRQVQGPRWSLDSPWAIVSGDFNGDGLADGAGRLLDSGQWWVAASDGTTLKNAPFGKWGTQAALGWQFTMAGDFNGDGKDDVIAQDNRGIWWVGISNGSSFQQQSFGSWSTEGWGYVNVADINGDGKTDVIGYHAASGNWWGALSDGTRFETIYLGNWAPDAGWHNFLIGDVTDNGADDIVAQSTEGYWLIGSLNANRRLANQAAGRTTTAFSRGAPLLGDFNGDGRADLAITTDKGQVWVKLSTGTTLADIVFWGQVSPSSIKRIVAAGDINGDGRDDLIDAGLLAGGYTDALISTGSSFLTRTNFGTFRMSKDTDPFVGEFGI